MHLHAKDAMDTPTRLFQSEPRPGGGSTILER